MKKYQLLNNHYLNHVLGRLRYKLHINEDRIRPSDNRYFLSREHRHLISSNGGYYLQMPSDPNLIRKKI